MRNEIRVIVGEKTEPSFAPRRDASHSFRERAAQHGF